MGILGMVKERMAKARGTMRLRQQVGAEMKARSLEEKAEGAKKLRGRLERQEAARLEIQKTKELKRGIVKGKVRGVISSLSKIKKHMPKGKGMEFGGGGVFSDTGRNVFSDMGKGIKPKKP